MTALQTMDAFGRLNEPATLTFQRILPGTVQRIWSYLTEGELRRKWLAAGDMRLEEGAPFEFVWRNDELSDPPGVRPEGFGAEHRMESRITALDPPRRIAFAWGPTGEVEITLEPAGERVLLTLTHRRISDRANMLMVGAGWHAHLDILALRLEGREPAPFWESWLALKADYDRRLPS